MTLTPDELPSHAARVAFSLDTAAPTAPLVHAASVQRWARAVAAPTRQAADDAHGSNEARRTTATWLSNGRASDAPREGASVGTPSAYAEAPEADPEAFESTPASTLPTASIGKLTVAASGATALTAGRTVPLAALRDLHSSHRQVGPCIAAPDLHTAEGGDLARPATTDITAPTMFNGQSTAPLQTSGRVDSLQSLIESCCDRLWVSDGRGSAPQGVMLDLGRWMPGCTIEVARAAGVLRLQMRGVDEVRRRDVEEHLGNLGAALADKLGCQVVSAVEGQQGSQR